MKPVIQATNLNKFYAKQQVLSGVNFTAQSGEIIGVVGTNGAGKSTLLKSLLGLTRVEGDIEVCGLNPREAHDKLMEKVSFIADTATLPKWITAAQLFEYTAATHPNFNLELAEAFLAKTKIKANQKVKTMSKGMVTQLHLALVIAIDSELLVLDEPTIGLDVIRRKSFYNSLLEDYFDDNNTIIITTHQIEEVENILTRAVFIDDGKIVLDMNIEDIPQRFAQIKVQPACQPQLEALKPIYQTKAIDGLVYFFDGFNPEQLTEFGEYKTPSLSDIFVALLEKQAVEVNHV
ncbi:ABC transporter ATP-binding protein [Catenovulum maritimum]|uniref:Multidrug ABC transporter ATP-binding protein n=1 Tax=Catenovulum maritimum TaxID=1513271 RepID=A0A0J8GWC6_9ALTE|nr:ABC transporter ATP-binding protein [Catenovulum maritimum]KMT64993.1 multidrug ABC transporter ATP-binding protein [Catenovulum maritimum]